MKSLGLRRMRAATPLSPSKLAATPCNGRVHHRWSRREAGVGLTAKDVLLGALQMLLQLPTDGWQRPTERGLLLALARQTRELPDAQMR